VETIITEKWNDYLKKISLDDLDIYYYEEYVKLYEDKNHKALCIVCFDEEHIIMMPYIRKEIDDYYDFETPYGYGGPICNYKSVNWIEKALCLMEEQFRREKYICGFIRFHPLLINEKLCENHFTVLFDRNTVAIDINQTEEEIWTNQIISKNRNMIRKANKNELKYKAEFDFASIDEFIVLYNATMSRLGAEEFYFFDNKYYTDFVEKFNGKAFLGTVRKDEKLICAAIFMYCGEYGHYHLEGSDNNFSNLAANNFLLWNTVLQLKELGVKWFHLGGGYNSNPDNSLLKFKKSFSNNLRHFYIGKWIFNEQKYCELKEDWMKKNPEKIDKFGKLLLCYRY